MNTTTSTIVAGRRHDALEQIQRAQELVAELGPTPDPEQLFGVCMSAALAVDLLYKWKEAALHQTGGGHGLDLAAA